MNDGNTNGGGYGNTGGRSRAEQYDSPSARMAEDFAADASAQSQASPVMDAAVDGIGVGLHNQSEAFRSQTQIAYDVSEEE